MASFSDYSGSYLSGADLQGREHLVTIERIPEEEVGNKLKLVAYFVGRRKSLPLNKGNIAVLRQAYGDDPDNCRGASVVLFPEQTRAPNGQPAIGVRIKLPQVAQPQPAPPQPQPAAATFAPNVREGVHEPMVQEMDDEIPF